MSKVADNDMQMMIATQIAYLDCTDGDTVKQIVDNIISTYKTLPHPTAEAQAQYNTAVSLRERLKDERLADCNNWVVKEHFDHNNKTGFYGCLIDTNDGDAILGFRGSESYDKSQMLYDWGGSDIGLLNNMQTPQQYDAKAFTEYINKKYGDTYNTFHFSGHSLGGNLAEHAIITAPDGMRIGRCTSWDGPGFSDEYIAAHHNQIAARAQHVDHYQWSVVGTMLMSLPGTNYATIAAHNGKGLSGVFWRHDTKNIDFGADGKVVYETQSHMTFDDYLSRITELGLGGLSKGMEIAFPLMLPVAFLYPYANDVYQYFAEAFAMNIEDFKQKLNEISNAIGNWFQNTFDLGTNGIYEMHYSAVNSYIEELDRISNRMRNISNEVISIANRLPYYSVSGAYYKSKIKRIGNSVHNYGNKGKQIVCATHTVIQRTQRNDYSVAVTFSTCASGS